MKAVVNERYGSPDVLEVRHVPKPDPGSDEVLIKVYATTVSRTDYGNLRPQPPLIGRLLMGLFRPKWTVLGMDFAGIVEAVGANVTLFKPGESVFGLSSEHYGAHAEFLCMPERGPLRACRATPDFKKSWSARVLGMRIPIYNVSASKRAKIS